MPVQQAPVHRHLKWTEGTAGKTSGKDRETINQRPYILVEWHVLFLLVNQVKEGMCLGWEKKEVTGCQELCRTLAWQTATWSQQWQSPNPGKSLLPLLKILMRIWSARQGPWIHLATACFHQPLSPYLLTGRAGVAMKETRQHSGAFQHKPPRPPGSAGHQIPQTASKHAGWHQEEGKSAELTEVVYKRPRRQSNNWTVYT